MIVTGLFAALAAVATAETAGWCPKGGCWEKPQKCHYDPCEKVCGAPGGDLFVVEQEVSYVEAHKICHEYGGVLATVNNANFVEATTDAFKCTGPFSETWIRAFDHDTHDNECLVLITGVAAPGGGINVPNRCHKRRYTLCSRTQPYREYVAPSPRPPMRPLTPLKPAHEHHGEHHGEHCGRRHSRKESSSESSSSSSFSSSD